MIDYSKQSHVIACLVLCCKHFFVVLLSVPKTMESNYVSFYNMNFVL